MKVETVPIGKIVPYINSPHRSARTVAKVAASIKKFGWRQPIVVDAGYGVVAGHTRLLAAQRLGLKTVPVHVAEKLTPTQADAFRHADSNIGQEAEWDELWSEKAAEEFKAIEMHIKAEGKRRRREARGLA